MTKKQKTGSEGFHEFSEFIGRSEAAAWLRDFVCKVAPLDGPVLITGQTGTGKDLVARAIHKRSSVSKGPFRKIGCSVLTEKYLETEIFERAKETEELGTLLLDEVADLTPHLQSRLLAYLEKCAEPKVPENTSSPRCPRLLATTSRDLRMLIDQGSFRQDLFFRLATFAIHIPPLRDRREDITDIAHHFLLGLNDKLGTSFERISPPAMNLIESHDWPGNVRELFNILETAALIEPEGETLTEESIRVAFRSAFASPVAEYGFPPPAGFLNGEHGDLGAMLEAVEGALIREALARTQGVQTEAAKLLGIGSKNLWKKLRKHSIEARDWIPDNQDISRLKQMIATANVLPFQRQTGTAKPAQKPRKKSSGKS